MSDLEPEKQLAGYRSKLTAHPGDRIDFMVHSAHGAPYEADLVRFVHADLHRRGPGLILEEIEAPFAGTFAGAAQDLRSGSCFAAALPDDESVSAVTFVVAVFPTLYLERDQTLAECCDVSGEPIACLRLGGRARLSVEVAGARLELDRPLPLHRWSFVGFALDAGRGEVALFQSPQAEGPGDGAATQADAKTKAIGPPSPFRLGSLTLASRRDPGGRPRETWNGRMDSPRLVAASLGREEGAALVRETRPERVQAPILGFWDFSTDMGGREVRDLGPANAHGTLCNLPNRAVRGFRWTGAERDWRRAPLEYGAIHFHETDVYDMAWPVSFSYTVPDSLRSGAYAARLRVGEETEYVTFFVSDARNRRTPRPAIALVLPTATYLAYSNEQIYKTGPKMLYGIDWDVLPESRIHAEKNCFGPSHYESHPDGSGVHFTSWLRPIWNLNPSGARVWAFPADTGLIHWLESRGFEYDVITDHDLHEGGAELASRYRVLVTGTHPEYLTDRTYDAYEGFLSQGGRLMYMGGNGFYWRVAMNEAWPAAIELRRAESGTRAWASEPGEYHHAFDGAMGGLWRRQGRAPNRLTGVGFAAQGFTGSAPYRRAKGAEDPRAAFLFDGVPNDVIGDFGLRQRGAAGEEIDRFDPALGSPPHALVLATSDQFEPDNFAATVEDMLMTLPEGADGHRDGVRADLVFFETPSGGAVFSTGSIAWTGSLSQDHFENEVARISENALRRFADPEPFVMPPYPEPEVPSQPFNRRARTRLSG